ncbi:MAG: ATP-dependent 6-phosphofructokinase [Candidatus Hadarchaeales archaeon]
MRRIAVATTGGDAPGMNACIRAVVRGAVAQGMEVVGIEEGFEGMIEGKMKRMNSRSVSGIINRGGTILRTSRCEEIRREEGIRKAIANLRRWKVSGLIIIGGEGSFRGGWDLHRASRLPIVGIPASIDNDIAGTELTIGFDTAVNTALEAINKIRDTAFSHERVFLVEVMGRTRGFLALEVGLACGAEMILIPEVKYTVDEIVSRLREWRRAGKSSIIIVMAEGAGSPDAIAEHISDITGYEVRVSRLGYIQRGGAPTALSIKLAMLFGTHAVGLIKRLKGAKMLGIERGKIVERSLNYPLLNRKKIDMDLYRLANSMSI